MTLDYRTAISVEPQHIGATPAEPLSLRVVVENRSRTIVPYRVNLAGLDGAMITTTPPEITLRPGASGEFHIAAELPSYFPAGLHLAAVEVSGGHPTDPIEAIAEVEVDVQSIATARIEMERSHLRGALGDSGTVLLHNTGTRAVTFHLAGQSPEQVRSLRFRFRPEQVSVPAGATVPVPLKIYSRPRLVGTPTSRAFDIVARGPSGRLSVPGSYTHRALIPNLVFKIIAVILLLILTVMLVRAAIRTWVVNGTDIGWVELADPDIGAGTELTSRYGHTAVWLDFPAPPVDPGFIPQTVDKIARFFSGGDNRTEGMVIWGGEGLPGIFGNGAFYRADDQQWIVLPHEGEPSARVDHTAVFTGETMVVWGGTLADSTLIPTDTGAEYNPATRRWDSLPASVHRPRTGHTLVWTGAEMIMFGGIDPDGQVRSDGAILTPALVDPDGPEDGLRRGSLAGGTWTALPAFPGPARYEHSATWTGSRLIIFGGYDSLGEPLSDAYVYDPLTGVWEDITRNPAPEPRACHEGLWTGARVVYMGGTAEPAGDDPCGPIDGLPTDPPSWTITPELIDSGTEVVTVWEWGKPEDPPNEHLGTEFSAIWTANEATIIQRVPQLDTIAATRYRPSGGSENLPLPQPGVIGASDQFTSVWINGGIIVWGGVDEDDLPTNDGAILVLPDR